MRFLLLLIFLWVSHTAAASTNYMLTCLKNPVPDQYCQTIQTNWLLWKADIDKVAADTEIPAALFTAIIAVESHFNPHARSHRGSIGLTQIQARTAHSLGYSLEQLQDPYQNLQAGALYLKALLNRHNNIDTALVAYKTGRKIARHQLRHLEKTYRQQVLELDAYFAQEAKSIN